jgi:hypothetical protein
MGEGKGCEYDYIVNPHTTRGICSWKELHKVNPRSNSITEIMVELNIEVTYAE